MTTTAQTGKILPNGGVVSDVLIFVPLPSLNGPNPCQASETTRDAIAEALNGGKAE